MHELSIAQQLVGVAEPAARAANAACVRRVRLRLGRLAGVVRESLEFAYELVTEGTLLAGSTLDIEDVPVVARCKTCAEDVAIAEVHVLRCPRCGLPTPEILSGRELEIVSLDYDPAPQRPAEAGSSASVSETGAAASGSESRAEARVPRSGVSAPLPAKGVR
jgi:hydrogenase nickel incorporation protein HypA/HybF